jgi:hypothetical protein
VRASHREAAKGTLPLMLQGGSLQRRGRRAENTPSTFGSRFFVPDHEMDHSIRRGDEEPIEIIA